MTGCAACAGPMALARVLDADDGLEDAALDAVERDKAVIRADVLGNGVLGADEVGGGRVLDGGADVADGIDTLDESVFGPDALDPSHAAHTVSTRPTPTTPRTTRPGNGPIRR